MNNFSCFLHRFDAMGTIVGFRIDGNNRKRTSLGGLLTLAIIAIGISTLVVYGKKYINKSEIFQRNMIKTYQNGQTLNLNKYNFLTAAKFNTYNYSLFNESWNMGLFYVSYDITNGKQLKKSKVEEIDCIKSKWIGVELEYDLQKIDEATCYNFKNVIIDGNTHYGIINKLELQLIISDKVMNDKQIQEEITNLTHTKSPTLEFYFYNSLFSSDIEDKSSSFHFIDKYTYEVQLETLRKTTNFISLDDQTIVEDRFLASNEITTSEYTTKATYEKISIRNNTSNINLILEIVSSPIKNITIYSYTTLSEMVSRVGGIINLALLLFQLIIYVKNYIEFEYSMTVKYFTKINEDITVTQCPNKSWIDKRNTKSLLCILNKNRLSNTNIQLGTNEYKNEEFEEVQSQINIKESIQAERSNILVIPENQDAEINDKNKIKNISKLKRLNPITSNEGVNYEVKKTNAPKYTKYGTLPSKVKNISIFEWVILKYFSFSITIGMCKCNEKEQKLYIYNKVDEYLSDALNVYDIEQRYMELEMLKLIMFDKVQLRAFQNISFLKGYEDITQNKAILKPVQSDYIDPNLEKDLQILFTREDELDKKLIKYFE